MAQTDDKNDGEWMEKLQVGDKIDVHDEENWSICKILKINRDKKQIKVHFEGWNKKYDQWINIKVNKKQQKHKKHHAHRSRSNNYDTAKDFVCAPLNTYTTKCEYFAKLKKLKNTNNSSLVYFYSNIDRKRYLIITSGCNDDEFVNKYDITNESNMKCISFIQYPHGFTPINNGNILGVSDERHILYMFGGKTGVFGKLNLNNGSWQVLCKNMAQDMDNFDKYGVKTMWSPSMFWVDSDLHIFGKSIQQSTQRGNFKSFIENVTVSYHIKYDKIVNKCVEISDSKMKGFQHLNNAKIIYIKYLKKFLNFSGKNDVFYCDDMNGFQWNKSDIKLPGDCIYYFAVNVCEYLVFIFYFFSKNNKEIWMLDLNENKWYKSHKKCPSIDMRAKPHIINTMDGWLHFVGGRRYHFKLLIDDIITSHLHNKYDKMTNVLLNGYIKEIEKKYKLFTTFNDDLIRFLISYYPQFGI